MKDRRNFFLRLLAALSESRQRQAAHVIKRHAHLIAGVGDYRARRADNLQPATETLARIEASRLINLHPDLMPSHGTCKEVVRMNAPAPRSQTTAHGMSRTVIETALIVGALMIFGAVHVIGYSYIERAYEPRSSLQVPNHMLSAN